MIQPPEPKLNPEAQPWGRWVTRGVSDALNVGQSNRDNMKAVQQGIQANASQIQQVSGTVEEVVNNQVAVELTPAAPDSVWVVSSATQWTETGNPDATVTLAWDTVNTDPSGEPVEIAAYQVLMSQRDLISEVRRNYNTNPKLAGSNTGWTITGTGVTVTSTAEGASLAFGSSNTDFKVTQTAGPVAVEGESWGGSMFVLASALTGSTSLRIIEEAYDASNALLASATGPEVSFSLNDEATIETGILEVPAGTAYTKTSLVVGATSSVPAGTTLIVRNGLHTRATEVDVYFDGDSADTIERSYDWAGTPDASESREYAATNPYSVVTAIPASPSPMVEITNLVPANAYAFKVRAVSVYGVLGYESDAELYVIPSPPPVALIPSDPLLATKLGLVTVTWDGMLGESTPLPGFSYVFAELAREGTEDWAAFGPQLRRRGTVNLTGEPIGSSVRIRLRSVDMLGNQSDPSNEETVTVLGVEGPDIEANAITANHIEAGSIGVTHLSPSVGDSIDISANDTITIIAGELADTTSNLEEMQTVYSFSPTEAVISSPGSNFTLALDNDSIEIREGGVPVSWWNSGQMHVPSFVGETVILGNHQLEKYGTGTVMRAL